jgi:mono/diheme cytochrome c family protein
MRPSIVCEPVSRNEVILGLVALVLVGFSLVVSLVIPRRRPDFPGNRTGLFVLVAIALVIAMLAAVEVWGEEEPEGGEPAAETGAAGAPGEETGGGETTTGEGGAGGGDAARGKELFASEGCGGCHTFEDAGTSGTVGPNLDEAGTSFEEAVTQIENGGGGMPAYGGDLSEEDIRALAAYVVESARR